MVLTNNNAGANNDGDASAGDARPNNDAAARRAGAASGGDNPNSGGGANAADTNDDGASAPARLARDRHPPASRPPAPARDRTEVQAAGFAPRAARLLLQLRASPYPPAHRRRSSGSPGVPCLPPLRFAKAQTSWKANEWKLNRHASVATIFDVDRCVLDFSIFATGLHQLHRLATRPHQRRKFHEDSFRSSFGRRRADGRVNDRRVTGKRHVAPAAGTTNIIPVAQGCGPGFHRGPRGACRPNRGPIYAPVVRRCPPGFFVGPRGVCRRRY